MSESLHGLLALGGATSVGLADLLERALLSPIQDLLDRPKKSFRGELVELGFRAASREWSPALAPTPAARCRVAYEIVEGIHAGSLIIDDIQDRSRTRRGSPTLHLRYGLPVALNAGNWLYFWPLSRIRELDLPADAELQVHRLCHDTLLRAHFGQSIDVGTPVDSLPQGRIAEVCLAALELKSGALVAFALRLGALLASGQETPARAALLAHLDRFGHRFGVALQMFDDLGNLGAIPEKKYEDLYLKRPSWLWAVAARELDESSFGDFRAAVARLPDEAAIGECLARHRLVDIARAQARDFLDRALAEIEMGYGAGLRPLRELAERLAHAYG